MAHRSRRSFLKKLAAGTAALGAAGNLTRAEEVAREAPAIDRRKLGRIGADVGILGLGLGSSFTEPYGRNPEDTERILTAALSHGVNYWDTARAYGISERMIGPVVEKHRDQIFLVSKSGDRSYDGFKRDLERSLENLRTDHIDIYHIHNLKPWRDKDLRAIENGAVRAAREARDEGIIGSFGVTGHSGAGILIDAIKMWEPDALLTIFPANRPDDGQYEDELLPLAIERDMGVIAMKVVRWVRNADIPGPRLIRYALSLPGVATAIVGLDSMAHLEENVATTANFQPMSEAERMELATKVVGALPDLPQPWDMPGYEDGIKA